MNIIYTRTSSKYSYKLVSPERQIAHIYKKFPYLKNTNQLILKEQCKGIVPLKDRKEFSKILSIKEKINQYVESVSRIGRNEKILKEFMKQKNITPKFTVGDEQVLIDRTKMGEKLRKFKGKQQSDEAKIQTEQLNLKRKLSNEKGEKFDGRKTLDELYPKLSKIILNNPNKSLTDIINQAYIEGIHKDGKKLSREAIRQLKKKLRRDV